MFIILDLNTCAGIAQDAVFETRQEAEEAYNNAYRQALRGLRDFPEEIIAI